MVRRGILLFLLVWGIALAACRSKAPTATPEPAKPVATATAAASPTGVSTPPVTGTPTAGTAPIVLQPPNLVLRGAAGEQTATLGPFFWVLDSGFAGETSAPGLVPPSDRPLPVRSGETLRFALSEDRPPQTVKLAVYPQEGNFEKIAGDPAAPEGFVVKTDPVAQAQPPLEGSGFSWTVPELPAGSYFIRVEIEWPQHPKNPRPDKLPRAVYAFWVQVS
ncbi:hypothetical protein OO015_04235 [Thermomicrobium sp. 4228-Ro]|uniref:hypothetical protein n=1 Tax=Thermomicrobium sp. 4228-Ro TaxID=2993937 RepID=UPI0022490C89|nr:hypothetical protein [Thermomicrobium sp. 4228-Ro]MCX2726701.1 hypothetical protein [Thermomicrobium sp. 4228-Ro]